MFEFVFDQTHSLNFISCYKFINRCKNLNRKPISFISISLNYLKEKNQYLANNLSNQCDCVSNKSYNYIAIVFDTII